MILIVKKSRKKRSDGQEHQKVGLRRTRGHDETTIIEGQLRSDRNKLTTFLYSLL